MKKLLAIIRHEYFKRVRSAGFIVATVLGPVLLLLTITVPVLITFLQPSAPRIAVLDQTGRIYEPLRQAVEQHKGWSSGYTNPSAPQTSTIPGAELPFGRINVAEFTIEKVDVAGRSIAEVRGDLTKQVLDGRLDAFLIIPPDILTNGRADYFARSSGDLISDQEFDDYLTRAVIEQRMAAAGVDQNRLHELAGRVVTNRTRLSEHGEEKMNSGAFFEMIGVGLLLFMTLAGYGGSILTAVTQDKESRLVEVLFSSVRPFILLLGKLIGVSLVGFTQYSIWIGAVLLLALPAASLSHASASGAAAFQLPVSFLIYLLLFFLVGYFVFATIYAVIGALLSGNEDSSGLALMATAPLVIAFTIAVPVMRSPNSWLAIGASFFPLFSPILMPIRILAQTPPTWQILLSLLLGVVTAVLLLKAGATVYRTAMLMYGKKVAVTEVWRWARQW